MKKTGLILLSSLFGLTLTACGPSNTNSDSDYESDDTSEKEDSGNEQEGGSEGTSYDKIIDDFTKKVEDGFSIVAYDSSDGSSLSYDFGVNKEGFWYRTSIDGSFNGHCLKLNGNSYKLYNVDEYGEYSTSPIECSKDNANLYYQQHFNLIKLRLFQYTAIVDQSKNDGVEYYLTRMCTSYTFGNESTRLYKFTVDDELKINLKFRTTAKYEESTVESYFRISEMKIGNSVQLPL